MVQEAIIRKIKNQDEGAFVDLIKAYTQEYIAMEDIYPVRYEPIIGKTFWDEVMDKEKYYIVLVVEADNHLIGFCIGQIHNFDAVEKNYLEGDKRGEVWDFYVEPAYRSQGIGEKVLMEMEKEFLLNECQNMVLNGVDVKNDKAKKLYERMGYKMWKIEYYKNLNSGIRS